MIFSTLDFSTELMKRSRSFLDDIVKALAEGWSDNSDAPSPNKMITKYVSRKDFLQQILAQVETTFRVVVRQELELRLEAVLGPLQSSQRCSPVNRPDSSTSRSLQLIFANKLQSTFYTDSKIVAEGHSFITVQLVDANSREVIDYAPFGSVGVEIFAIRGDFAVNGQEDQSDKALDGGIVHKREGRRPLLIGDLAFSLTHGVGFIKNVVFTDNSSWLRSRKFRLGVRTVPTTLNRVLIKEGISEAFVVKDRHGESSQKHPTPQLDDPLWRLNRISKTGAVCTVLAENGIHTVKDFLQLYHVNPRLLRDTVVGSGLGNKTWETIVKHANKCCLGNDIYSYYHAAYSIGFLVNSVYKVLGVTFDGINYQAIDSLDPQQMVLVEQLKQYIYVNPNVLHLDSNSSSTYSSVLSQFQKNVPVYGASLDHWVNATSNAIPITNQGNKLDVSHSYPSCSNTYTIYGSYQQEEDIATHSAQLIERGEWGSWSQPGNEAYDWNSPNPMVLTALPDPFTLEENRLTQTSPWHPVGTWATASGGNVEFSCPLQTPGSNPAGGKSKARWLKVRSVLMWKVVKRDAAAKKKGKSLFEYYHGLYV